MGAIEQVKTLSGDAEIPCYMARPQGEISAAIIVIQEIFGVNEGIRAKCDHWASKGYLAIAPTCSGGSTKARISTPMSRLNSSRRST